MIAPWLSVAMCSGHGAHAAPVSLRAPESAVQSYLGAAGRGDGGLLATWGVQAVPGEVPEDRKGPRHRRGSLDLPADAYPSVMQITIVKHMAEDATEAVHTVAFMPQPREARSGE
jgi:hypothetical protein